MPMKVFVDAMANHPLAATVRTLADQPAATHALAASPEEADLIVLCGSFTRDPHLLTGHPLYRRFRSKTAVYSCDDHYCPLAPGVYASPRRGLSTVLGRVQSHAYASSYGLRANAAVLDAAGHLDRGAQVPKSLLCSFEGSSTSRLRRRLFALDVDPEEAHIRDTSSSYRHFVESPSRRQGAAQEHYVTTMLSSHFVLCPRGVGTGTLRLFEAMSLGVAPVLLSDRYVLPRGPAWDSFLVRIPERRAGDVVAILRPLAPQSEARARLARAAWEQWFAPEVLFDRLVDAAASARAAGEAVDGLYRVLDPAMALALAGRSRARPVAGAALTRVRRAGGGRAGGVGDQAAADLAPWHPGLSERFEPTEFEPTAVRAH